jgi:hypothetical protein
MTACSLPDTGGSTGAFSDNIIVSSYNINPADGIASSTRSQDQDRDSSDRQRFRYATGRTSTFHLSANCTVFFSPNPADYAKDGAVDCLNFGAPVHATPAISR